MMDTIVKFHDTELVCSNDDGKIFVAIKPICKAIGVHTDKALFNIRKDEILKDEHTVRYVHDASGRQQEMFCLPIEYVHGWLFGIDSSKVKPEARPKLILFKKECYRVLFDHFFGKYRSMEKNLVERISLKTELANQFKIKYDSEKQIKQIKRRLASIDDYETSNITAEEVAKYIPD